MAPLEGIEPLNLNDWDALSTSRAVRGSRKKGKTYSKEDVAIEAVKGDGKAFKLEYSSVDEAEKMQARLKARAGKGVRVLTDETDPKALFIGPAI